LKISRFLKNFSTRFSIFFRLFRVLSEFLKNGFFFLCHQGAKREELKKIAEVVSALTKKKDPANAEFVSFGDAGNQVTGIGENTKVLISPEQLLSGFFPPSR
jgi:hypothetical protein